MYRSVTVKLCFPLHIKIYVDNLPLLCVICYSDMALGLCDKGTFFFFVLFCPLDSVLVFLLLIPMRIIILSKFVINVYMSSSKA